MGPVHLTHIQSPTVFSAFFVHLTMVQKARRVIFRVCFVYNPLVKQEGFAGDLKTVLFASACIVIMSVLCSNMN